MDVLDALRKRSNYGTPSSEKLSKNKTFDSSRGSEKQGQNHQSIFLHRICRLLCSPFQAYAVELIWSRGAPSGQSVPVSPLYLCAEMPQFSLLKIHDLKIARCDTADGCTHLRPVRERKHFEVSQPFKALHVTSTFTTGMQQY